MKTLRLLDLPVVAGLLCLFILYPPAGISDEPQRLIIRAGGESRSEPLAPDRLLKVSGPLGETLVKVEGGSVSIVESPCPGKLCVHQGTINRGGSTLACLPNLVTVEVEGGEERPDAVLR